MLVVAEIGPTYLVPFLKSPPLSRSQWHTIEKDRSSDFNRAQERLQGEATLLCIAK
jgi:hypothetical protein